MNRRVAILALAAALAFVAAALATPAPAATQPCWKRLVNDWYDGRIDRTYPVHCYREAIRNLPRDVDEYSSAREDIQRALQQAIRRSGNLGEDDPVPPEQSGGGGGGGSGGPDEPTTGPGGDPAAEPSREPTPEAGEGPVSEAFKTFRPETADSVPLPLIILAGLAGLLLAGAGASYLARRYQTRREGLHGPPPS